MYVYVHETILREELRMNRTLYMLSAPSYLRWCEWQWMAATAALLLDHIQFQAIN